jgi:hypothetical protein
MLLTKNENRYSVVDSVNGDQDRAVDALLAMNDPNHVPASSPARGPTTQIEPSLVRRNFLFVLTE